MDKTTAEGIRRLGIEVFCCTGTCAYGILDELAPLPEEIVLRKLMAGAFVFTSLDILLRSLQIKTLLFTGKLPTRVSSPQRARQPPWVTSASWQKMLWRQPIRNQIIRRPKPSAARLARSIQLLLTCGTDVLVGCDESCPQYRTPGADASWNGGLAYLPPYPGYGSPRFWCARSLRSLIRGDQSTVQAQLSGGQIAAERNLKHLGSNRCRQPAGL